MRGKSVLSGSSSIVDPTTPPPSSKITATMLSTAISKGRAKLHRATILQALLLRAQLLQPQVPLPLVFILQVPVFFFRLEGTLLPLILTDKLTELDGRTQLQLFVQLNDVIGTKKKFTDLIATRG
ncbi:hypothetical protein ACE6H2_017109 [Prunus campanulata]